MGRQMVSRPFSGPTWLLLGIAVCIWLSSSDTFAADNRKPFPPLPPAVTVVLDDNFPPLSFRDASGQLQGFLKDSWRLWEQRTGIPVHLNAMKWADAQKIMEGGGADVIDTLGKTPAREKIYDYSEPYISLDVALFYHKSLTGIVDANTSRAFTIGVKAGDVCISRLHEGGADNLRSYPNYQELVEGAARGEVGVFCMNEVPADYLLTRRGISTEFRRSPPLYSSKLHWAVRKGNPQLYELIAGGFARITPQERQALEKKWLGSPPAVSELPISLRHAGYTLLAVSLLAVVLVGWNRTLQRRVRTRTAELTRTLDEVRKLSQVVEQSPNPIMIADEAGCIEYVNGTFTTVTGFAAGEVVGRPALFLDSGHTPEEVQVEMWRTLRRGEVWKGQFVNCRKDGEEFVEYAIFSPVRDQDDRITHFLGILEDVTERKRIGEELDRYRHHLEELVRERTTALEAANRELELRREDAEAANRAKSMFLATMSHELRTPLNAILGLSEMLQEGVLGALDQGQMKAVATIEESGRHLLEVITDILDLSKIEADRMELEHGPVELDNVCQASLRFVREAALKRRISLSFTMERVPETLDTDMRRLKQILVNLLGNAVKFTPEGGKVGLEVVGDGERGEVRFTVWDTGIGIAPADQEKLFQPFVQVDSSLARRYEGTGLGLTLVARLTELLGGTVGVSSEPDRGSRFTINLPWAEAGVVAAATEAAPPPAPAAPRTSGIAPLILLAEDNRASREMTSDYLQAQGCRVMTAGTGGEAVALAGERQPDLILMDIQMPGMNGLSAIREIRKLPPPVNTVPIIALTALAMPGDEERCRETGADDYLGKPYSLKELYVRIAGLQRG